MGWQRERREVRGSFVSGRRGDRACTWGPSWCAGEWHRTLPGVDPTRNPKPCRAGRMAVGESQAALHLQGWR